MSESVTQGERVFLILLGITGVLFLVGSRNYSTEAQIYPVLTSIFVIVASGLLLFRDKLPKRLERVTTATLISTEDFSEERVVADPTGESESDPKAPHQENAISETHAFEPLTLLTIIVLSGAFLVSSYLFGMLWMAPIFVLLSGHFVGGSWKGIVPGAIVVFLLLLFAQDQLHIPFNRGILVEFELPLVLIPPI